MTRLARLAVVTGFVAVVAGCGGSVAAPRHGVLFTYDDHANAHLWCGDCATDVYVWKPGSPPRRLTDSVDPKGGPQWSPDGRTIAWAMPPPSDCRPGDGEGCGDKFGCVEELFVARSDGSHAEQVTSDPAGQSCTLQPSWSPDGTKLVVGRWHISSRTTLGVIKLSTATLRPVHVEGRFPVWGKPGIAYLDYTGRIELLDPHTDVSRVFADPAGETTGLAWSSRGELAAVEGKRIVIYSSGGRLVRDFTAPRPEAPAGGSGVVWSPDGKRLLVCIDPYGELSFKAHERLVNTRQKRDRYPPLVSYLVDRDGTHWRRLRLPDAQPKESLCDASSWR